jgi:PTS system nitrogen regulatory IIA component
MRMVSDPDLLRADAVRVAVPAATKKALFAQAGALAAAAFALDAGVVADALAAREKLGSTGFGGGVAIPHAKLPGLPAPVLMLLRLGQPIDFRAVDEHSVDLVAVLLSPMGSGADHLKALAHVSRRLRDVALVAKLRGAGSADALYALWAAGESAR